MPLRLALNWKPLFNRLRKLKKSLAYPFFRQIRLKGMNGEWTVALKDRNRDRCIALLRSLTWTLIEMFIRLTWCTRSLGKHQEIRSSLLLLRIIGLNKNHHPLYPQYPKCTNKSIKHVRTSIISVGVAVRLGGKKV